MNRIARILYLIPGFFIEIFELAKKGSRDLANKQRFKLSILDKGCCFDSKTILDKNSRVLHNSILNNVKLGSYSYVGRNCLIQNVKIGKFCSIANDVMIGLGTHPINLFSTSPLFYRKQNTFNINLVDDNLDFEEYNETIIKNDVWIGARVTILDGVTLGNGAIIASGAVVTKDVPPYAIAAGVPAKIIKYRFEESKIDSLTKEKWWNLDLSEIKNRIKEFN